MGYKDKVFQVLLNAILAVGCLMQLGETSIIDLLYYKRVKVWLLKVNIMESCNYQLLEAFVLLGNYVQKRNKPNTSWNYLGIAIRMAITFGLHKEVSVDVMKDKEVSTEVITENLERRRRLWWSLFYFDVGHSITFGRPLHTLEIETIDINLPLNADDSNLGILPTPKSYPTVYASLIHEARLSKVSHVIYSEISKFHSFKLDKYLQLNKLVEEFTESLPLYFNEDENISDANIELSCPREWYHITIKGEVSVPKWFPISRGKLIWRYKNLQMLMFRSFIWDSSIKESNALETAINICTNAASYTISSVSSFIMKYPLDTHSSWYCTYFIFQAVLIPILICVKEINRGSGIDQIQRYLNSISMAQETLLQLQNYNILAFKLLETVKILLYPIENQTQESNSLNHLSSTAMNLFSNIEVDLASIQRGKQYNSIPIFPSLEEELFPHDTSASDLTDMFQYY